MDNFIDLQIEFLPDKFGRIRSHISACGLLLKTKGSFGVAGEILNKVIRVPLWNDGPAMK